MIRSDLPFEKRYLVRCAWRGAGLAGVLLVLACETGRAQQLPRAEIAKRGKAATAFVELAAARYHGTACCIHPSGLFLTHEGIALRTDPEKEFALVLDANLPSQRTLKARVVRIDKALNLALLRADGAKNLPSLALGSAEGLTELMDLFVFGFSPVPKPPGGEKEYPPLSVLTAQLTSLHRREGELVSFEIDRVPRLGPLGCPVLDDTGKVVGIVASRIRDQVYPVIPVNRLARFLATPDLEFRPPKLTRANLHQSAEFELRVVPLMPPSAPLEVEMVLRAGEGKERRLKMDRKGTVYRATAVPVAAEHARTLEVHVRIGNGSVQGTVRERTFQVGAQTVHLGDVKQLVLQPKPRVVLKDGKPLEGAVTGLETVEVLVGDQPVMLPLGKAAQVQVLAAVEVAEVACTFVATEKGKEVGRLEATLPVQGAALVPPGDPGKVVIRPPALEADRVERLLPAPAADVSVGGGGRYLVLHLPKLRKLAIFDVNEAKVTRYLPLTEDKVVFAAGLDKVLVGLRDRGILERWDLTTGEKELANTLPSGGPIGSIILGSASNGPALVNGAFLDLQTFKPLPIKGGPGGTRVPVSADGTVFGAWNTNLSPGSSNTFVLQGNQVLRFEEGEVGHVVPAPDGRVVYTARGVRTSRNQGLGSNLGYCLPAVHGNYFMALTPAGADGKGGLSVYLLGNDRPLAKLDPFPHGLRFDGWDREESGPWKRIFFLPRAHVIALLPTTMDRLVLHRFDVEAALEQSGIDYLLVTSPLPGSARRGATFTHQLAVKSKKGGVTYRLEAGPPGMILSAAGLLTWPVSADAKETEHSVILTVRDAAGQECYHTFTLKLE